jgi:hypothetical protein
VLPLLLMPQEAAKELLLPLTLQGGAKVFLLPLTPQVAAREPGAAKEVAQEEAAVVVVEREGVGAAGETSRCSNKATFPKPCRASYKR